MPVAIAKRALDGDPHCGDEAACWQTGATTTLCMIDGLGHGEYAEEAARAAVNYVAAHLSEPLADIFTGCDSAIRHSRGVAMGIAVIDEEGRTLTYAGIGNTRAMIAGGRDVRLASDPGIVGGGYRALSPDTVPLGPSDLVIMSTDGVEEMIDMSRYPGRLRADERRLAEQILQDWGRATDDAAVLVFRSRVA